MAQTLTLVRSYLPNCCIGSLYYCGELICYTVEQPWRDNEPFKSCIPEGTYSISKHSSTKYPNSFILSNPNLNVYKAPQDHTCRYACLIHIGNFPHNVKGCIAPGMDIHPERWGVSYSRNAMEYLMDLVDLTKEEWELHIK